jgi:hypothetical protein
MSKSHAPQPSVGRLAGGFSLANFGKFIEQAIADVLS